MARSNRIGFISMGSKVCERLYNFEWFMGLSLAVDSHNNWWWNLHIK